MRLQQGTKLHVGRGAGPQVVLAQPHQGLELLQARVGPIQPAQRCSSVRRMMVSG
jgi:hypothetical protein